MFNKLHSMLLLHHLGLGDHFIFHGLVREYCQHFTKIGIFSKPHNFESVSFMFRDLQNLKIIQVPNDEAAKKFIWHNKFRFGKNSYTNSKIVGFNHLDRNSHEAYDKQLYRLAGVDFEKKWTNFHVERDLERERLLAERFNLPEEYIFIHEDPKRSYIIDRHKITTTLPAYSPDISLTKNIFDYCGIFEKAKEIHVIDSSFMSLIDCLPCSTPGQKLYLHKYATFEKFVKNKFIWPDTGWQLPTLKKDWQVLTNKSSHP